MTEPAAEPGPNDIAAALWRSAAELPAALVGATVADRLRGAGTSPDPAAARASGDLLLRLGYTSHAEAIYHALAAGLPNQPAGHAGLAQLAMQQQAWPLALARWDAAIAIRPDLYARLARMRVLEELGRHADAEAERAALGDVLRDTPAGLASLAQRAARQGSWPEALHHWDALLARHPNHPGSVFSRLGRAETLLRLDRPSEAAEEARSAVTADPLLPWGWGVLTRALLAADRCELAAAALAASPFADSTVPRMLGPRLRVLMALRRHDAARDVLTRHIASPMEPDTMDDLLAFIPQLLEGWDRTAAWLALAQRLDGLPEPTDPDLARPRVVLQARLRLALRDHSGCMSAIRRIDDLDHAGRMARPLRSVARALADPRFPDAGKRKLFGIGLSRTATTTLAAALETLGYSTLHWTNPLTNELISDADLPLFDAFTDTPVCMHFERYFHQYPDAKFIYTTRPFADWEASFLGHWRRQHRLADFATAKSALASRAEFFYGNATRELYLALYFSHADLQQAYASHDRRVRNFFADKPASKLLEFNVFAGDGWSELSTFLGVPQPAVTFPFERSRW